MSKTRDIRLFVGDVKESIEAIREYVEGLDFEGFAKDRKTYSAVIREFEIIGEAVKHLPENITSKYGSIGWRDIKDFRNLLIHEYFGVDIEIVWNTIHEDLPKLYEAIVQINTEVCK